MLFPKPRYRPVRKGRRHGVHKGAFRLRFRERCRQVSRSAYRSRTYHNRRTVPSRRGRGHARACQSRVDRCDGLQDRKNGVPYGREKMFESSYDKLRGLDILVINCLRFTDPHPTHMILPEVLEVIGKVAPPAGVPDSHKRSHGFFGRGGKAIARRRQPGLRHLAAGVLGRYCTCVPEGSIVFEICSKNKYINCGQPR